MPSAQKRKVLERTRKRRNRGVLYLVLALVLVAIIVVGVYAYVASLPPSIEYAKLTTSKGLIEVELYRSKVPITVDNFVSLAKSDFYHNLTWHRVAKSGVFVIQTGDPTSRDAGGNNNTWGQHGSSQMIPLEIDSSLHNYAGYLGMARGAGNDTASSQFYINSADNTSLDGRYAVFGKVISGMDVVAAIASVPIYNPPDGQPITPVFLTSVTISNSP